MTDAFDATAVGMPREIGGYLVIAELNPQETYLTLARGRRQVVCKRLDPDCFIREGSKLHPHVRDRLRCVREIPHGRVANLYGVERDPDWEGGFAYLVWEHVIGESIDEWITRSDVKPRDVLVAVRELLLAVDALHARGIVHGAIHARNVVMEPSGLLRLTHVSPLLYTEVQNDVTAISILLSELAKLRTDLAEPLAVIAEAAGHTQATLRGLAAHEIFKPEATEEAAAPIEPLADQGRRGRMRWTALAVVIFAIALGYGIRRFASRLSSAPPSPPVAPAAALRP